MTTNREMYLFLMDEQTDAEAALGRAKDQVRYLESKIDKLKRFKKEVSEHICTSCHGQGKVWISYAQDDTKLRDCETCKGRGVMLSEL